MPAGWWSTGKEQEMFCRQFFQRKRKVNKGWGRSIKVDLDEFIKRSAVERFLAG
jgi:hypothetical protein